MKYSRLKLNSNNLKSQIKNNVRGGGLLLLDFLSDLNPSEIMLVDIKTQFIFHIFLQYLQ